MGALDGVRVVEFAGIGPGPFAATMLADLGADVVRIERSPSSARASRRDVLRRNRRTVVLNVKLSEHRAEALDLIERADVLIEGYRPGVMERLGLGPAECRSRNDRLVYARITGWGQDGPYSHAAGHDINYIALSGTLAHMTDSVGTPVPPLNLLGDFGGGALYLVVGILAALVERDRSGSGQEVDAAMVDGAASLMSMYWGLRGVAKGLSGVDEAHPHSRLLDGGAPHYGVYACADERYVSVGALEPDFYRTLVGALGLADEPNFALELQNDTTLWPARRTRLEALFRTKDRSAWCDLLEGTDACFAPVLTMSEALTHEHNVHRRTFVDVDGIAQPRPAPRFSRTPSAEPEAPRAPEPDLASVLADWGRRSAANADSARVAGPGDADA